MINFKLKTTAFFVLLLFFPIVIIALDGATIISNATGYLDHEWYCNDWNARTSNADTSVENNDPRYPFYPQGARYLDETGTPQISTGSHTGVAYAWGLRERTKSFEFMKVKDKK